MKKTNLNIIYRLIIETKSDLAHLNSDKMTAVREQLGLEYPAEVAQVKERFLEMLTEEYKQRGGKRPV